jgi:hypothetical protein
MDPERWLWSRGMDEGLRRAWGEGGEGAALDLLWAWNAWEEGMAREPWPIPAEENPKKRRPPGWGERRLGGMRLGA